MPTEATLSFKRFNLIEQFFDEISRDPSLWLNLARFGSRCSMFLLISIQPWTDTFIQTFVWTCKLCSLCELQTITKPQPRRSHVCVFLEQNSHAEIKPTLNRFFSESKWEEITNLVPIRSTSNLIVQWEVFLFWCASIFDWSLFTASS
jgi:hypothetical protein